MSVIARFMRGIHASGRMNPENWARCIMDCPDKPGNDSKGWDRGETAAAYPVSHSLLAATATITAINTSRNQRRLALIRP